VTAATDQSNADRLLADGLAALGIADAALVERLSRYLDLIERWNRTYNLTAVRDREEMVTRHLIDSLAVLPFIEEGALADLGSGAGLPGIPLAMARPGLAVTLVEANGKKARFLREAVRQLDLGNVRVAESRAESLAEPGRYDCLTARAFGTLAELIRVGGHLLSPTGYLLALKGQRPDEEIAGLPPGWRVSRIEPLAVPGMDAQRHLVIVERDTQQGAAGCGQGAP